MALSSQTMFNYGISITKYNRYLDFVITPGGLTLTAVIDLGYYSLQSLGIKITNALSAADITNNYTFTIDRSLLIENRITITTSGSYLELLFETGPYASASVANTIGFLNQDYTGSISYTGANTSGITLLTQYAGYNYMSPDYFEEVQGAKTVSASGIKESIVFQIQEFIDVEFKYEPISRVSEWKAFFQWAIQQREFEMTPQYADYNTVYRVTLEKTAQSSSGLGFKMKEMLPSFPNEFQTGALTFRVIPSSAIYITG